MSEVGSRLQRTYEKPLGLPKRFVKSAFWWEHALTIHSWQSDYSSVNATLRYLHERKIGSEGSRRSYGYYFALFCTKWRVENPDELTRRSPQEITRLVTEFVEASKGWSNHYKNTVVSYLSMHFRNNGFDRGNELGIRSYRVPRRARINAEYIPSNTDIGRMAHVADAYGRALILFLYGTGLRVSTLCAIKYCDIRAEFESGVEPMFIPIFPEMKRRVPGACKGDIPYYTFIKGRELASLRIHVGIVKDHLGDLFSDDTFLFPPMAPCTPTTETARLPLSRQAVFHAVKHLAKKAGIPRWFDVYPHCIRKAYERVLRSPKLDGSLVDVKTQEFLMGHVLPGQQDNYYGSVVYLCGGTQYNSGLVNEIRTVYEGLSFNATRESTLPKIRLPQDEISKCTVRISELEEEIGRLKAELDKSRRSQSDLPT